VGGTILDENFRVSPVLSSTRRSDTQIAPARATVGTNRSRASPFRVTRACPAASLFAPGLGERGLQLAARAAPRIVRARPADLVCDRLAVSLAVFLEDAPIGVPSSPATAVGSSVLQPGGDAGHRAGGGSAGFGGGSTAPAPTPTRRTAELTTSLPAPARRPRRGRPPAPVGSREDDRVRRATYYLHVDLLDELDRFCSQNATNKSEVACKAPGAELARRR